MCEIKQSRKLLTKLNVRKMKRHLTIKNMKNFTHWNVLYDLVLSIHSLDSTTHNVTLMTSVDYLNPIFICMSH